MLLTRDARHDDPRYRNAQRAFQLPHDRRVPRHDRTVLCDARVVNAMGGGATGYRNAAIVFSLLAVPFFIITVASFQARSSQSTTPRPKKVSFIKQFKVLKGNWPVIQLAIAYLGWGIIQGGMTFRLYFCTYNAGDELLYVNTQTLWSVMGMVGAFSVSYLVSPASRTRGHWAVFPLR